MSKKLAVVMGFFFFFSSSVIFGQAADFSGIHTMTDMPKWQIMRIVKGLWPSDFSAPVSGIESYDITIQFDRQVPLEFVVARFNIDGQWQNGKIKYMGGNTYGIQFDFGAVTWARVIVGVNSPVTGYPNIKEYYINAWKTTPNPITGAGIPSP